jgi:hypothetical protein
LVAGNTTIHEIEKLLKVVNRKIYCDRNSGYIGEGRPSISSSSSSCSAQDDGSNKLSGTMAPPQPPSLPKQTDMAPPPPSPLPKQTTNTTEVCKKKQIESMQNDHDDTSTNNLTGDFIMPPPGKRKRLLGPTKPPSQLAPSSAIAVAPKSSSQKQAGTLSFLNQISSVNTSKDNKNTTAKGSKHNIPNPSRPCADTDTKKDEWVAPKGQDGSGRTKLNEKFAGRY